MGTLYIVSTPIGNLEDITIRAIKILLTVPIIACEDTRHTGMLISHLKKLYAEKMTISPVETKYISYNNENEFVREIEVLGLLSEDKDIALVSDSGTPLFSDPGYGLVRYAVKKNAKITVVPGANAALSAVIASGLPVNHCLFLGFPPEKQSQRLRILGDLATLKNMHTLRPTVIFYCAPHKLRRFLEDIMDEMGDIQITVVRELTKIHEEVWRGSVAQAREHFENPQGEFVLLFNPDS